MLSTTPSIAVELNSSYYSSVAGSMSTDGFPDSALVLGNMSTTRSGDYVLPAYIRTTSLVVCILVMVLGIVGNLMVPLVVLRGKDMRNSTNIFLVNLSVADLCVLLVCAPTVLVEVNSKPEVWVLGELLCKAVPFVEMTVAHASVLTILAISFERYYAICEPLRAGYVCTKARATVLCLSAWAAAALCTSPIIWIARYVKDTAPKDGLIEPHCWTPSDSNLEFSFFLLMIILFFIVPFVLLVVLYSIIVRHLIRDSSTASTSGESYHARARKQVVLMLLTVVFSFFICLTPFRILTILHIFSMTQTILNMGGNAYFSILYFSRIMLYLNSAINPILYNLMSSRFRLGFLRLCGLRSRRSVDRSTFRSTMTASRLSRRTLRKDQPENFV